MNDNVDPIVNEIINEERPVDPAEPFPDPSKESGLGTDGFDPAIHQTGPDGRGVKNKDGSWRLKPGRKVPRGPIPEEIPSAARADYSSEYRMLGQQVATLINSGILVLTGDPLDDPCQRTLADVWAQFFAEYGIVKIPAWVMAPLITGIVCFGHCSNPKYHDRLAKIWDGIRANVLDRRRVRNTADGYVNPRSQGQRQNDTGGTVVPGPNPPKSAGVGVRSVPGSPMGVPGGLYAVASGLAGGQSRPNP